MLVEKKKKEAFSNVEKFPFNYLREALELSDGRLVPTCYYSAVFFSLRAF